MKEKKELIDAIVDHLKSKENIPYNEGAWERFQKMEQSSSFVMPLWSKVASAVAFFIISLSLAYISFKEDTKPGIRTLDKTNIVSLDDLTSDRSTILDGLKKPIMSDLDIERISSDSNIPVLPNKLIFNIKNETHKLHETLAFLDNPIVTFSDNWNEKLQMRDLPAINPIAIEIHPGRSSSLKNNFEFVDDFTQPNVYPAKQSIEKSNGFNLHNDFSFGVYVAPNSTADNLKVGAGVTLAYNLSDKVSIRTGASYNSYEVGILKDPLSPASIETVYAPVSVNDGSVGLSQNSSAQVTKMTLPNVNAISGFVESIEIPLEMKYNISKSFYAAAGVSYSTIIHQERNAQYIENIDVVTFKNGFPATEKEAKQAMQAVTKTVKSSEENVNTNSYNGFVNLSVGKKINLNAKFGLSVEPYYKIPVGAFRQSDMKYNNGGIRIMTTF